MQNSKGFSSGAVVALVAAGLAVLVLGGSYVSAYNAGNQMEQTIKATYENNQNILSSYQQKVQEAAQVPGMMTDDIVKVTQAAITGRYGDQGSRAVFQAISERNPQVSEKLYVKLQEIIEGGREEFKTNQTRLIDTKRAYETNLGSFWRGSFMHLAGYPKINLGDYKVVKTDSAVAAFKTGRESGPIQLRPRQQ
ncbi:hypothetical protein [Burkholderia cenocepacia]|uniref:hypothetical protein n=1 Tax=Burkholderia cenocepacia TaxID=95486 RepID=UPI00076C5303|nr:hypothetical protein [Burkholderia cenocepacia]KWU19111.1 hypothetical protein AS149_12755 [Burkholderia cenocepacia]